MIHALLLFLQIVVGRTTASGAFGRRQGAAEPLEDFVPSADVPRPFRAADDTRFLPALRRGALRLVKEHNGNLWHMLLELPASPYDSSAGSGGDAPLVVAALFRRTARAASQDDEENGINITAIDPSGVGGDLWWSDAAHDEVCTAAAPCPCPLP